MQSNRGPTTYLVPCNCPGLRAFLDFDTTHTPPSFNSTSVVNARLALAPGGYGVAPTAKVHSGTPLCPGGPIVVCRESIQRVWFGEPRMM